MYYAMALNIVYIINAEGGGGENSIAVDNSYE